MVNGPILSVFCGLNYDEIVSKCLGDYYAFFALKGVIC